MFADRSSVAMNRLLSSLELGGSIFEYNTSRAVRRYLSENRKRRDKEQVLRPLCLEIMRRELSGLPWDDDCFHRWVEQMFTGADLSQLEHFKSGYQGSRNKTSYFLTFIKTEL